MAPQGCQSIFSRQGARPETFQTPRIREVLQTSGELRRDNVRGRSGASSNQINIFQSYGFCREKLRTQISAEDSIWTEGLAAR